MTMSEDGSNGGPKGSLNERAMWVDLSISTWHTGIKDRGVSAKVIKEHHANKNAGHFRKNLLPFESSEYNAIRQAERDARGFYWEETAPWNDSGIRLLLGSNFMHVSQGMREKKGVFDNAVAAFLPQYPELCARAAKPEPVGLGEMFRQGDYPDLATLQTKFSFKFQTMPIPSGTDFRLNIAGEELESLKSQFVADLEEREQIAMRDVWGRLYAVVKKAADDLGDKKKPVHKSLFENAKELCDVLPRVNIAGSPEFDRLLAEVQEQIANANPEIVRKSPTVRRSIAAQAAEIEAKMAQFMQPRG